VVKKVTSCVELCLVLFVLSYFSRSLAAVPTTLRLLDILVGEAEVTAVTLAPNVTNVVRSATLRGRVPKALLQVVVVVVAAAAAEAGTTGLSVADLRRLG
jgi:hypothetical protein